MRTSPQSVVISGQTDTLANVHKIKWQVLLIAAISVSEVRSEGEPAEKVDEGPGESRRGGETVCAAKPVDLGELNLGLIWSRRAHLQTVI